MAQRILIRELQPNQFMEGVFAINNCQLGQTRNGKPFLKCLISDRTGKLAGRMWSISEEQFHSLPTDGFVWLSCQSQPYQGEMQLIIQEIYGVDPEPQDLMDLLPSTPHDINLMYSQVVEMLGSIKNPSLASLAKVYLADETLMARFKAAPAAMTLHHAYLGGLLEHTCNLMKLAKVILPLYPKLNADIVMIGLFLHDLGKCAELTWETGFGYSDDGHLVGHIARGLLWLEEKAKESAAQGQKISAPLLRVLHHIILSHHGKPEFGALKIPATPEAIAINLIDNLDAKIHMGLAAGRPDLSPGIEELGGAFTEKVWALETRIYKPDPTTLPPDAP